jgi:hypothetical protein
MGIGFITKIFKVYTTPWDRTPAGMKATKIMVIAGIVIAVILILIFIISILPFPF